MWFRTTLPLMAKHLLSGRRHQQCKCRKTYFVSTLQKAWGGAGKTGAFSVLNEGYVSATSSEKECSL